MFTLLDSIFNQLDGSSWAFMIALLIFTLGSLVVWFKFFKKETKKEIANDESKKVMLAAYERLTLLTNRIALPNLISRLSVPNSQARDFQQLLTLTIKEEFEFNVSQQIYVSTDAFNAVKTLKDQNILIINQIGAALPEHCTGADLSRVILDFLMNDKRGTLHEVCADVLANEAKKLMTK